MSGKKKKKTHILTHTQMVSISFTPGFKKHENFRPDCELMMKLVELNLHFPIYSEHLQPRYNLFNNP